MRLATSDFVFRHCLLVVNLISGQVLPPDGSDQMQIRSEASDRFLQLTLLTLLLASFLSEQTLPPDGSNQMQIRSETSDRFLHPTLLPLLMVSSLSGIKLSPSS